MTKETKVAFGTVTTTSIPPSESGSNESNGKIDEPTPYLPKWQNSMKHFMKIWHFLVFCFRATKCLLQQYRIKRQIFGSEG